MKRVALLTMVVGAVLVAMVAGVAAADNFVCKSKPCYGTNGKDQIGERNGSVADRIFARDGDDDINARRAGKDTDVVFGQGGDDFANTNDGDSRDKFCGGPGSDSAVIDAGDVFVQGNC